MNMIPFQLPISFNSKWLLFEMMDLFFTNFSRILAYPNESCLFSESYVERMIDFSAMKASSTCLAQQILQIYENQAFLKH